MAPAHPMLPYEDRILRMDKLEQWPLDQTSQARIPGWAETRADMSKATPWFRQNQSGIYHVGGRGYGVLLSAFSDENAYIDAEIIITSLNGEATAGADALLERAGSSTKSQTQQRVDAFRNSFKNQTLVGVVAEKYSAHPNSMNRRHKRIFPTTFPPDVSCIGMDWFMVVDIWAEKRPAGENREVPDGKVWKIKLEKRDLTTHSWWARSTEVPPPLANRDFATKAASQQCAVCGKSSPRLFQNEWFCRNDSCGQWCHLVSNGQLADFPKLTYDTRYLQERTQWTNAAEQLKPLYPDFNSWHADRYQKILTESYTKATYKSLVQELMLGFKCPLCCRLNQRVRWNEWHCAKSTCTYTMPGAPPVLPIETFKVLGRVEIPPFENLHGYKSTEVTTSGYTVYNFKFAKGCRVAYWMPNSGTNARPNGADAWYERMMRLANTKAIDLERRRTPARADGIMTNHFSENFGHTYNYAVSVPTRSFTTPPREIKDAVDYCYNTVRQHFRPGDQPFNEMYLAGYFEDMGMDWHTDGEVGLGPVIATWTLGGSGSIDFAVDQNYYNGTAPYDDAPRQVPNFQRRRTIREQLDKHEITEAEYINLLGDIKQSFTALKAPRQFLRLPMVHGSIVVMAGEDVQRIYKHRIQVSSPFRFAVTCRYVSDENDLAPAGRAARPPKRDKRKRNSPDDSDTDIQDPPAKKTSKSKEGKTTVKESDGGSTKNSPGAAETLASEKAQKAAEQPRIKAEQMEAKNETEKKAAEERGIKVAVLKAAANKAKSEAERRKTPLSTPRQNTPGQVSGRTTRSMASGRT